MKQKYSNVDKMLLIFLFINSMLSFVIVPDYGRSWDEEIHKAYSISTIDIYKSPSLAFEDNQDVFGPNNLRFYGPFYTTVSYSISKIAGKLLPQWHPAASLHYVYFLTFLLGVYWLYMLSKRIMSEWAAFGVAILFATQPLLFGHAFINPKDTPFMVFFIGGIYFGIKMVDGFNNDLNKKSYIKIADGFIEDLKDGWVNRFTAKAKKRCLILFLSWTLLLVLIQVFKGFIYSQINQLVELLFNASQGNWVEKLVTAVAGNRDVLILANYQSKMILIFDHILESVFVIGFVLLFIYFAFQFGVSGSYKAGRKKAFQEIKTLLVDFVKSFNKTLPSEVWKNLINKNVILAGVMLGLISSIRILGPFVGLLIIYYFFLRSKERSIPAILAYTLIALITSYLTWPYLWSAPFVRFIESITVMTDFPWNNYVLFGGKRYIAYNIPRRYLPQLVTIQFTEPLVILAGIGIIISFMILLRNRPQAYKLHVYFLWIGLPVLGVFVARPVIYDNFRQFLFIMPPLFIFAGITLDIFYQKVKPKWITILVSIALILPVVFTLVRLHPYQYIYFNSFVGGTSGAFRSYEMDYWMTAFKEATEYLNENVPDNAKVAVYGPDWIIKEYIEKEIEVSPANALEEYILQNEYDYQIIPTRSNYDLDITYFGEVVFSVEIDGATLVDVVEIKR